MIFIQRTWLDRFGLAHAAHRRWRRLGRRRRGDAERHWDFQNLVAEALDELPRRFRRHVRNIAVVVERAPSRELLEDMGLWRDGTLLGLYQGVPLPQRSHDYGNMLPDRIVIFQKPLEAMGRTWR